MPSGEMPREEGNFDTLFLARQHCYGDQVRSITHLSGNRVHQALRR
jgi:hypothetical protein